ncbi:dpt-YFP repressor by overexpression [Musca autumnalis]|uniref:dpt-YFP repressor by overexpression n=1 Tax=Musca autumnalis TaxID=221902 RepID=UPI003CE8CEAE
MYNKGNNSNSSSSATATSTSATNATTAASSTTTVPASNNNSSPTGPNDRIEWSRATILGFIEDYRRQRVLWDPNTKGYHIKQTKYEALKALGQKYGAEIRSIRSKIKSLRSSFHREHGKVINGRRKGLNYQPMWFAYDAIRFILDGETGDSDEADGTPKNDNLDSTSESNLNNNNNSLTTNNNSINSLLGWSGHATDEEQLLEERKISSRDIEHFNNHFLALGLQARHPMAMLAAVEAAAAASALSAAAQEKRQEQDYALLKQQKQQQQLLQQQKHMSDNDDDKSENGHKQHDSSSSPSPLKIIELSTISNNNNNSSSNNVNIMSSSTNANTTSSSSNAITATLNPISKPFASPKPSSPSAGASTTTKTAIATATTPPPQTLQPPAQSQQQQHHQPSSTLSVTATEANTCSPENYNVLHGSRSLDENSAIAIGNNAAATAISSLPITAVTRTSDFDGSEYCNISAEDVKTEIFESDSTELAMLESTRTSTPVPLNYHKNATDLTIQRNGNSSNNGNPLGGGVVSGSNTSSSSRKRKAQQIHSNANHGMDGVDAPSPSKLLQQHSNAIQHSRQCDYLNNSINGGAGFSANGNTASNNTGASNSLASGSKSSSTPIDEYGVFGEYVAITIRKLKTSKAKIVVKHLINNLLYEAELGKYDQGIPACKEPPELYKM